MLKNKTFINGGLVRKTYLKGRHPLILKTQTKQSRKNYFIKSLHYRSKIICTSYPDRDNEFRKKGFELGDDSLLNVEEKVLGKTYPLSEVKTQTLDNTPGIYAIRCISTNRHLVGETKNIKDRILTLKTGLSKKIENSQFVSEFYKYGIENFELILYETGEPCEDFQYRKFIEYKLQSKLSITNSCYNSGLTETKTERPLLFCSIACS